MPESQHNNPVEKEHDIQEVVSLSEGRDRAHSMNQQDDAADEKDHQVSNDNYGERDHRYDHERDYRLRQHGREIGDRERFPKENAPLAPLPVERVQAVEHGHDERGKHDHHRGH